MVRNLFGPGLSGPEFGVSLYVSALFSIALYFMNGFIVCLMLKYHCVCYKTDYINMIYRFPDLYYAASFASDTVLEIEMLT